MFFYWNEIIMANLVNRIIRDMLLTTITIRYFKYEFVLLLFFSFFYDLTSELISSNNKHLQK